MKLLVAIMLGCCACSKTQQEPQPIIKVDVLPSASTVSVPAPIDTRIVIGKYSTLYDFKGSKNEGRAKNIKYVASKLDSVEIKPGEIFSFNQTIGPRTVENGFSHAKEIFFGEMIDGVGGGTCQVSSTLFAAAIFSDLEIVERRPHSRPLKYIGRGLDATVAFPSQEICDKGKELCFDLQLRNPFKFPIVIKTSIVESGEQQELAIWFLGQEKAPEIKVNWKTLEVTPYNKKFRKTGKFLGKWKKRIQSGSEGISGILIVQNGRQREIKSRYAPVNEIWDVGLGWDMSINPWQ